MSIALAHWIEKSWKRNQQFGTLVIEAAECWWAPEIPWAQEGWEVV